MEETPVPTGPVRLCIHGVPPGTTDDELLQRLKSYGLTLAPTPDLRIITKNARPADGDFPEIPAFCFVTVLPPWEPVAQRMPRFLFRGHRMTAALAPPDYPDRMQGQWVVARKKADRDAALEREAVRRKASAIAAIVEAAKRREHQRRWRKIATRRTGGTRLTPEEVEKRVKAIKTAAEAERGMTDEIKMAMAKLMN